jgi:2-polyprenyl-6-methoxyphenol hydroxylase-like FAD-dependent oxidoreductase
MTQSAMSNRSEFSVAPAHQSGDLETDVCVIGAGLAGTCTAHVLNDAGVRLVLVDARPKCLPCFKAEKLEHDQIAFLSRFGLMQKVRPIAIPIHRIGIGRHGRFVATEWWDQYGLHYHDLVNALRAGLDIVVGHVADITASDTTQEVKLLDGRRIRARLVVLASGHATALHENLGIARRSIDESHSMSFGFMIGTASGKLPFDGVNYLPDRFEDRVDYLTLFPVPDGIRANLFTYHDSRSPIVRAMLKDPGKELSHLFSKLPRLIGKYEVVSKVAAVPTDLWVAEPHGRPGLALIGDAYQSAGPATGTGLTKVLNDVDVLKTLVVEWLSTPGMSTTKVDSLYTSPQKRDLDAKSLRAGDYGKRFNTERGLRMRVHRAKQTALMYWHRFVKTPLHSE